METFLIGSEVRSDFHFKIDLPSEICPYTECNMLKFITTFLKVSSSAIINFDG